MDLAFWRHVAKCRWGVPCIANYSRKFTNPHRWWIISNFLTLTRSARVQALFPDSVPRLFRSFLWISQNKSLKRNDISTAMILCTDVQFFTSHIYRADIMSENLFIPNDLLLISRSNGNRWLGSFKTITSDEYRNSVGRGGWRNLAISTSLRDTLWWAWVEPCRRASLMPPSCLSRAFTLNYDTTVCPPSPLSSD